MYSTNEPRRGGPIAYTVPVMESSRRRIVCVLGEGGVGFVLSFSSYSADDLALKPNPNVLTRPRVPKPLGLMETYSEHFKTLFSVHT